MAVMKIKNIKSNLRSVINYGKNGEKTEHGILPAKVQVQELTPEYYKEKRKNNMILEELNFLARHHFKSIKEVDEYKANLGNQLPDLKGKREDLWRKYHKTSNEVNRTKIKKEINELTEKIDVIQAQRNACNRIVARYVQIKEDYKNEIESKNKATELIKEDKKKKSRYR